MTLSELISNYRSKNNISQRQFSAMCGLSSGYISLVEKKINPQTGRPTIPTLGVLNKIAHGMGITIDELIAACDDMPVTLTPAKSTPTPSNLIPISFSKIPLVGQIACGQPILAQEHIEDYIDLPGHIHADFALACRGDSMVDAGIQDGDIVYIRQQPTVENGQIAAVMVDCDEATLKRFYSSGSTVQLISANPKYPPMVFTGEEIDTRLRILGLAVAFTHSFFSV